MPREIVNAREQRILRLAWPDGRTQSLGHQQLREACPCSQCRARRLRHGVFSVVEGVQLTGIELQGYGVQLLFSDGHDRGIYPWAMLAGLQPSHRT